MDLYWGEFFVWRKQEEGMSIEKYFTLEKLLYLKQKCNNNNYTLNWLRRPALYVEESLSPYKFSMEVFKWNSSSEWVMEYSIPLMFTQCFVNISLFLKWFYMSPLPSLILKYFLLITSLLAKYVSVSFLTLQSFFFCISSIFHDN